MDLDENGTDHVLDITHKETLLIRVHEVVTPRLPVKCRETASCSINAIGVFRNVTILNVENSVTTCDRPQQALMNNTIVNLNRQVQQISSSPA